MSALLEHLRRRRRAGFTLIELLIVIIIIGILVAIGVPAYLKYTAAANDRDAQAALQTAYKAAVAGDTEVNSGRFPVASTVVNDVKTDEPAATIARGDCYASVLTAPVKQVLVDPTSTSSQITICDRSASGAIWRLSGPLTGTPTMTNGSQVTLAFASAAITDAVRAAGAVGDGRTSDSSSGVWEGTTNVITLAGMATTAYAGFHGYNSTDANYSFGTTAPDYATTGFFRIPKQGPTVVTNEAFSGSTYTVSVGQTWTESMIVRSDAPINWSTAEITFWTANGHHQIVPAVTDLGNGTKEIQATYTTVSGDNFIRGPDIINLTTAWGSATYLDVRWARLEQKPIATPFAGYATTRAAGKVTGPAALLNTTQGWFAIRLRPEWASSNANVSAAVPGVFEWQDTSTKRIGSYWDEASGQFKCFRQAAGEVAVGQSATFGAGAGQTVICTWTPTTEGISVNGATITAQANTAITALSATTFSLGTILGGSRMWDGEILWFACGTGTLTNADAATINGYGNTDPTVGSFPSAAQADFVWDGTSANGSMK